MESITHLEHISDRRRVVQDFIASQASGKHVKEFVNGIRVKKPKKSDPPVRDADDFLSAFNTGFKGLG